MEFTAFISEDEPNEMVEWPTEDLVMMPVGRQYIKKIGFSLTGYSLCFKLTANLRAVSSIVRINRFSYEEMEETATLSEISNNPLTEILFSTSTTLDSADLEVLAPKEGVFHHGTDKVPSNWKLRLLSGHLGLLIPLNHHRK